MRLSVEFPPNTLSNVLPPGTYRLQLNLAAGNCRPVTRVVELTVTGEWFEDEDAMLRKGIGAKAIEPKAGA